MEPGGMLRLSWWGKNIKTVLGGGGGFVCLLISTGYVVLEDNSRLSKALEDKRLPETLFRTLSADNHGTAKTPPHLFVKLCLKKYT